MAMASMKDQRLDYPQYSVEQVERKQVRTTSYVRLFAIGFASVVLVAFSTHFAPSSWLDALRVAGTRHLESGDALCPQLSAIYPHRHAQLDEALEAIYNTEGFCLDTYEKLGGAVRIPTESFDDLLPVGQDPRWERFQNLHDYLEETFPAVYKHLNVTKVNTYALVYHWQGSDASLKPLLLTAHQDVVPVEPSTIDDWTHPPFSGHYDGTWIWGRGSVDDKSDLIALLVTIDTLLAQGFTPARSIVLGFGIDEESAGTQGAEKIAVYLEETYGRDSFAMLVDEGGGYIEADSGVFLAVPDTGEKGYLDVRVEVSTPGGHSSLPPKHTSIGMLSNMITEIEEHPHETTLARDGTAFSMIQCITKYSPQIPRNLKDLVKKALYSDKALELVKEEFVKIDPRAAGFFSTTQAVDLISGGVKVNALPETAYAVVNHRIAEDSSVSKLQSRLTKILTPIANKYNLSINSFGSVLDLEVEPATPKSGLLTLSDAWGTALEPAPVTPTSLDSAGWQLLSGTIQSSLLSSKRRNASVVAVSPGLALGNTDTKSYWNLTRNIFRYGHASENDMYNGAHTVDEAVRADSVVEHVRFFSKLILNVDETRDL